MTQGDQKILSLDYEDPAPPPDLLERISRRSSRLRRRRRVVVGGGAAAVTCAVLALGMSGSALRSGDPAGITPGAAGAAAAPADTFPGAPSIQAAVDQYAAAIRAGDGSAMARIVDKDDRVRWRAARIRKADGHPVTVTKVTVLDDTPSSMWRDVVLHLDDGGVRSTEKVMVGPASGEDEADPHHWKIKLVGP